MEWYIGIILYLAAGGVFTALDHLFDHVARSYDKKYPDPFSESKSLSWRLFHCANSIIKIISFFLVLPLICGWFDVRFAYDMVDKADLADRLYESNNHLLNVIEEKDARIKELEKSLDDEIFRSAQLQKSFDHPAE